MLHEIEQQESVYTVSELNRNVKSILEQHFPFVWVEGEISNFAAPSSGHFYFSLKDAGAQVRCAMFRGSQRKLNFTPKDGTHVLIKAKVTMYEPRGEYQLIAEAMEERGEGKLRREYELLKKKLEAAGLFAESHKKPLPAYPQTIGVVTSATGAAIRDILHVLKRRYPIAPVIIYPSLVQGKTAAPTIVDALDIANARNECDVLILARGGGSLEDLWPFNEEIVAHAIYNSQLPIISGVGHEVDFTIADFVADVRAPTPSAAAEMVTPDSEELIQKLNRNELQIARLIKNKFTSLTQQADWTEKHLLQLHPKRKLQQTAQTLNLAEVKLHKIVESSFAKFKTDVSNTTSRFLALSPISKIQKYQNTLDMNIHELATRMQAMVTQKQLSLGNKAATLDALSPLKTLQRGFAIATKKDRKIIQKKSDVTIGDKINVRLEKVDLGCTVDEITHLA